MVGRDSVEPSRAAGKARPLSATLFLPVERAFFERVNVTDHQNADETQHAPKDCHAVGDHLFVNHGPWIHEDDLKVEQDEEHRYQVKLYTEARRRLTLWDHPALVRHILGGRPFPRFSDDDADQER